MNLQSHAFVLIYLPVVLLLWRLTARWMGSVGSRVFLLCAGLLFCGLGSPLSLLVLCGEGAMSWFVGRELTRPGARKNLLLAVGVAVLLAVLALFKYTGWLLPMTPMDRLSAFAPLGLSFVTFQQLFWLRDCYYRENVKVSLLDYACCLTFFATATCGPITRVGELAPQLRNPKLFDWNELCAGLHCFALGLAKKVLLAGTFAGGANFGFARAGGLSGADSALTILCYTLQIYFDFSGYCDMAAGMARMMGIDLPVNFDSPYRACSVEEFWGRWHMTLTRFFRGGVYIPLGGNRRGTAVTCRNIMIVFLLSGLWHGAGWGFLIWGALHGGAMVLQRLCRGRVKLPRALGWVLTFVFVSVAWVFFRAENPGQALALLGDLFGRWGAPGAEFAAALPLSAVSRVLNAAQTMLWEGGTLFVYWIPLLSVALGGALLALPNPLRLTRPFRPGRWKLVLTVACLVISVLFLSGVETFIYANF